MLHDEDVRRVRLRALGDEPDDRGQHVVEVDARRDRADDLVEDAAVVCRRRPAPRPGGTLRRLRCVHREHHRTQRPRPVGAPCSTGWGGLAAVGGTASRRTAWGPSSGDFTHPFAEAWWNVRCRLRPAGPRLPLPRSSRWRARTVLEPAMPPPGVAVAATVGGPGRRRKFVATDLETFLATDGRDERSRRCAGGSTPGHHVHLLPVPLGDGPDHGQGRPGAALGVDRRKGFQLVYGATANLFVDRHGEYIGYGPEAAELVGIPEPETFMPLPWDPKVARVFCTSSAVARSGRRPRRSSPPTAAATSADPASSRRRPACTCAPVPSPR